MNGYLTKKEIAEKWGISVRRINTLCTDGRIEGATRIGNLWIIPENTPRPTDERITSGKYIKNREQKSEQKSAESPF